MSIFTKDGVPILKAKINPSIYAFISTELNDLNKFYAVKIGDTTRSVLVRIAEWRAEGGIYSSLERIFDIEAIFQNDEGKFIVFRDYSVHVWLERNGFRRIHDDPTVNRGGSKTLSIEFFVNDKGEYYNAETVIRKAVQDIVEDYGNPASPYDYYSADDRAKTISHYLPVQSYKMRGFQEKVVCKATKYFKDKSVSDPYYLLTSPTRSGKSFMAAQIAKNVTDNDQNNIVLVVSGMADVGDEWKQTFEKHWDFNQREKEGDPTKFFFLTKDDFLVTDDPITKSFNDGAENVVVFLTLQDISGSTSGSGIKDVHAFLDQRKVDFIIADEAHFSSFTPGGRYQEILEKEDANYAMDAKKDRIALNRLEPLTPTYGRLFITATPYNVLMSDNTQWVFKEENRSIITEKDIKKEARQWIIDNGPENEMWSPYFGMPEKKTFVIDLGEPPENIFGTDVKGKFIYPEQVKDIMMGMFGLHDDSICPNIIDDHVYKKAGLGNGIIIKFGRRSATDQAEQILRKVMTEGGFDEYEIINVSSEDENSTFSKMSAGEIKEYINRLDKKFILLTVNKILTGVTIEKADTIIFCCGSKSAQRTVQASGRPGTPYVEKLTDEKTGESIRICHKPNAAVISFDKQHMIEVTEIKSRYMMENSESTGNNYHEDINDYLEAEELYLYDPIKTSMVKATAYDIISAIIGAEKSPIHMIRDIPVSLSNLNSMSLVMLSLVKTMRKKSKVNFPFITVDEDKEPGLCIASGCRKRIPIEGLFPLCHEHMSEATKKASKASTRINQMESSEEYKPDSKMRKNYDDLLMKLRTVMLQCIFYVYLSDDNHLSVRDILKNSGTEKNNRIIQDIGLDLELLDSLVETGVLTIDFDKRIITIQSLIREVGEDDFQAFLRIISNLGSYSNNEIPTPVNVSKMLVDKSDLDNLNTGIIDPGCKSVIILHDAYHKAVANGTDRKWLNDHMYAVPTSGLAYAFTNKVFRELGWNYDNILYHEDYSSLKILENLSLWLNGDNDKVHGGIREMIERTNLQPGDKFDYCISNPPYQLDASTESNNSAHNIFHYFYKYGLETSNELVMVFPGGRWMQRSTRAGEAARTIYPTVKTIDWYYNGDESHTPRLFPNVGIPDGISVITADNNPIDKIILNNIEFDRPDDNQILPLRPGMSTIARKLFDNYDNFIIDKKNSPLAFGLRSYYVERNLDKIVKITEDNNHLNKPVKAFLANDKKGTNKRVEEYWLSSDNINWNDTRRKLYGSWKVCVSQAGASKLRRSTKYRVIPNDSIVGESWLIVGSFDTEEEASNYKKYLDTFTVKKILSESQGGKIRTWGYFVPDLGDYSNENPDIDWSKPLDPQLHKLFNLSEEEIAMIME